MDARALMVPRVSAHARLSVAALLTAVTLLALAPMRSQAHCDTLDGPVVKDARIALAKRDVAPALKWVKADGEAEVRAAFAKALAVRSKGPEARELADRYFFETLIRIHRGGEGAPFTGLKPAGAVEPPVAEADRALATGSVDALARRTAESAAAGVRRRFAKALEARRHANESVAAGRAYVAAYVDYVHYVERLHTDAAGGPAHEVEASGAHGDTHAHGG